MDILDKEESWGNKLVEHLRSELRFVTDSKQIDYISSLASH